MRKIIYGHIIGICCAFVSCTPKADEKQSEAAQPARFCLNEGLRQSTEIIAVEERPVAEQLTLSGKIEYNENDMVAFRSLLSGVVEQVDFELGTKEYKGRLLARIKPART